MQAQQNARINLRKFDINRIKDEHKVVMIGKTKSGKSHCLQHILSQPNIRSIPIGQVVSMTEGVNPFYQDFIPSKLIRDRYSSDIPNKFRDRQYRMVSKANEEIKRTGKSTIDPRAFLILDDCLSEKNSIVNNEAIKYIFFAGRHIKTFFAICQQYPLGLTPELRTNVSFTFLFREPNVQNRRTMYESFAGFFPTYQMFCDVLDQTTENFECMVIDNTVNTNKIEEMVFFYKAPPTTPAFQMCSPDLWLSNGPFKSQYMKSGGDDDDDTIDISEIRRDKKPRILVKKTDKFD